MPKLALLILNRGRMPGPYLQKSLRRAGTLSILQKKGLNGGNEMIGIAFLLGIFIGMEIGRLIHQRDECKRVKAELDQRMRDYCNWRELE